MFNTTYIKKITNCCITVTFLTIASTDYTKIQKRVKIMSLFLYHSNYMIFSRLILTLYYKTHKILFWTNSKPSKIIVYFINYPFLFNAILTLINILFYIYLTLRRWHSPLSSFIQKEERGYSRNSRARRQAYCLSCNSICIICSNR